MSPTPVTVTVHRNKPMFPSSLSNQQQPVLLDGCIQSVGTSATERAVNATVLISVLRASRLNYKYPSTEIQTQPGTGPVSLFSQDEMNKNAMLEHRSSWALYTIPCPHPRPGGQPLLMTLSTDSGPDGFVRVCGDAGAMQYLYLPRHVGDKVIVFSSKESLNLS